MTSISDAVNSFNSIKVQLRQSGVILFNIIPTFQFHKGTIKALSAYTPYGPLSSFNSIKVQLRRKCKKFSYLSHFLSIP